MDSLVSGLNEVVSLQCVTGVGGGCNWLYSLAEGKPTASPLAGVFTVSEERMK